MVKDKAVKIIKKCKILYVERNCGCEVGVWFSDGTYDPNLISFNAKLDFNEDDFVGKTIQQAYDFFTEEFNRQMSEMSREEREDIKHEDELYQPV